MVTHAEVLRVVDELRLPDPDVRRRAQGSLELWRSKPVEPAAVAALLEAATQRYPEITEVWPSTPNRVLVETLSAKSASVPPTLVAECLPKLEGEARWAATGILVENGSDDALRELAVELQRLVDDVNLARPVRPVFRTLERDPSGAGILLTPMMTLAVSDRWAGTVVPVLLAWVERGVLGADDTTALSLSMCPTVERLLQRSQTEYELLGPAGIWESEGYSDLRYELGCMLDLLGRLGQGEAGTTLESAAMHGDSWIAMWGIVGCLRLVRRPPEDELRRVAREPECRIVMYEALHALGLVDLLPASERTQSKLAESDMVRWLMFPTELGRPPDKIEEIARVGMQHEAGPADLYAFRFRVDEPETGDVDAWMVGVAGPFLRGEPNVQSLGSTFSRFDAYDPENVRESIEAIVGTIDNWAKVHHQAPPGTLDH